MTVQEHLLANTQLKLGGPIPESYRLSAVTADNVNLDNFVTLTVSKGSSAQLDYTITQPGAFLRSRPEASRECMILTVCFVKQKCLSFALCLSAIQLVSMVSFNHVSLHVCSCMSAYTALWAYQIFPANEDKMGIICRNYKWVGGTKVCVTKTDVGGDAETERVKGGKRELGCCSPYAFSRGKWVNGMEACPLSQSVPLEKRGIYPLPFLEKRVNSKLAEIG